MEEIITYQHTKRAEKNSLCKSWEINMTEQFNAKIDLSETKISSNLNNKSHNKTTIDFTKILNL
jgi:hypothetical protein